ncbi:Hypothetical predicted protein [Pelobates cultripes]|uniref:Uncharacterized protein n=1 Tax=Pelobates cultripes TaxID=61616 RepID=A0AAD1W4R0_PELCU|nr:Hypothetical predicted protein [Pelobates cultripes]
MFLYLAYQVTISTGHKPTVGRALRSCQLSISWSASHLICSSCCRSSLPAYTGYLSETQRTDQSAALCGVITLTHRDSEGLFFGVSEGNFAGLMGALSLLRVPTHAAAAEAAAVCATGTPAALTPQAHCYLDKSQTKVFQLFLFRV